MRLVWRINYAHFSVALLLYIFLTSCYSYYCPHIINLETELFYLKEIFLSTLFCALLLLNRKSVIHNSYCFLARTFLPPLLQHNPQEQNIFNARFASGSEDKTCPSPTGLLYIQNWSSWLELHHLLRFYFSVTFRIVIKFSYSCYYFICFLITVCKEV